MKISTIKKLNFSGPLTKRSKEFVSFFVVYSLSIDWCRRIDIEENHSGNELTESIRWTRSIYENADVLEELCLSGNRFSTQTCKQLAFVLSKQWRYCLEFLFFFHNEIRNIRTALDRFELEWNSWNWYSSVVDRSQSKNIDENRWSFKKIFSQNNVSLEKFNLEMNGLGNQGVLLLSNILSSNDSLIELNLSNNRIENDGAAIFASKLENNRRLRKLWVMKRNSSSILFVIVRFQFGNNLIGTLGSLVLLKAIDHKKSQVEYLNLQVMIILRHVRWFCLFQMKECSYQWWFLRSLPTNQSVFTTVRSNSRWNTRKIGQIMVESTLFEWEIKKQKDLINCLVPEFTIMDDLDLKVLDEKSLHALFQRDPLKILRRMVTEGNHPFLKALKKWDIEEHGDLTYSIYVIDFPSAVKVNVDSCIFNQSVRLRQ